MHRVVLALFIFAILGLSASAQRWVTRVDPEADPKAFDITTRADLEDSMRRVASLRAQLADAAGPDQARVRDVIHESILRLCQDELNKHANASGAVVVQRSTDARTPGMAVRWTGAFQMIEQTMRELGPEALALYERNWGPRADALVTQATTAMNLEDLASLNRRFGLTAAGLRASEVLAAVRWERGEISASARSLERALHAPELLEAPRLAALYAWLSHCYRDLGERANLARLLELPAAIREQKVDKGGASDALEEVLRRNLAAARDTSGETLSSRGIEWPGGNYTGTGLDENAGDYSQVGWVRSLPGLSADAVNIPFMGYPSPITTPFLPQFDGNLVFVNTGDRLVAYDLVGGGTGEGPLWACRPFPPVKDKSWRTIEPDPAMILPTSMWQGTAFAALENPLNTDFHDRNPEQNFGLYSHYPQVRRALCAIDASTGRLLWKLGGLYHGTPDDTTSFLYSVVHDGVLYAIGSRSPGISEIFLYALRPESGELIWNLRLCYGQQETTMFGRPARTPYPSLCAIAGGELYLCTNIGGIVAVDLARRCLNWISRYDYVPRPITKYTETYYRDVTWANNPTLYVEVNGKPVILAAPTDSEMLFALDAISGEILWRLDRFGLMEGGRYLVGVRGGRAYVAGDGGPQGAGAARLVSIDIAQGRRMDVLRATMTDGSGGIALSGRPCMTGNRLYWPGHNGRDCYIAEFNLDSRRVVSVADVPRSYLGQGFSVFSRHGILFTVSGSNYAFGNSQLAARFNQSALLESARAAARKDPQNVELALRFGLLAMRLGDRVEAMRQLQAAFEGASQPPVNARVREHASRALVAAYLSRADALLGARKPDEALAEVDSARKFALLRSQQSDCFARQERALQGSAPELLQLYERLVEADPDFGVGEDPEIPARIYGLIRLAALLQRTDPTRAATLYQLVQEGPERLSWQGQKLRVIALAGLKTLIATSREAYAPQDRAAEQLLTGGPDQWREVLQRFPLAIAADDAALNLASQALDRRDGPAAAQLLLTAIEENQQRPRRAEMQALLALAHFQAGEKLRARLVASRTLREFPQGRLKLKGQDVPLTEALRELLGAAAGAGTGTAQPRLPAQLAELWSRPGKLRAYTHLPRHPVAQGMPRVLLSEQGSDVFETVALDTPSGEMAWKSDLAMFVTAVHETQHGALLETAIGFVAVDDIGQERWSLPTAGAPSPVSLESEMLVFGSRFSARQRVRVHAVDTSGGGEIWKVELEASNLRWIGQSGSGVLVLMVGNDQQLCLLDAESGTTVRNVVLDFPTSVQTMPVIADGNVWLVDGYGQVRGFRTDDLSPAGSFNTGQRGTSLLRIEEGRLFTAGIEGQSCIEISTGKQLWAKRNDSAAVFQGGQYSRGVAHLFFRDHSGNSRIVGMKAADGTAVYTHSIARADSGDRLDIQATAAFDGGVAAVYAVYSIAQGVSRLGAFRMILLNNDGTERMNWSQTLDSAATHLSQLAIMDDHLVLVCGGVTRCFGRKE